MENGNLGALEEMLAGAVRIAQEARMECGAVQARDSTPVGEE